MALSIRCAGPVVTGSIRGRGGGGGGGPRPVRGCIGVLLCSARAGGGVGIFLDWISLSSPTHAGGINIYIYLRRQ